MENKKKYVSIFLLVLLLLAGVVLNSCLHRKKVGKCENIASLPVFGKYLPVDLLTASLDYQYTSSFGKRRLQARGQITDEAFNALVKRLGLSAIYYDSGFPGGQLDGEEAYLPKTSGVAYATYKVPDSSIGVEFMFEKGSGTFGTLYISIGG